MATRYMQTSFWEDTKVQNIATPEDRYMMLYFMTNPHTNQLGCYEISLKTVEFEVGYNQESIKNILNRLSSTLDFCDYDEETNELLIRKWYKYNWTSSVKVKTHILKLLEQVKSQKFKDYFTRVCIPFAYPSNTLVGKKRKEKENKRKEIIEYLEENFKTSFSPVEIEVIDKWEDDIDVIKLAIKQAVLNKAKNIKYIDKILFNWKKEGFTAFEEIQQYLDKGKNRKPSKEENTTQSYYRKLE